MPAVVEPDEARAIGEAGSSQPSDADRTRTEAKRDGVSTAWPRRECGAVFSALDFEAGATAVWRRTQPVVLTRDID